MHAEHCVRPPNPLRVQKLVELLVYQLKRTQQHCKKINVSIKSNVTVTYKHVETVTIGWASPECPTKE